jgi:hypothetical protein
VLFLRNNTGKQKVFKTVFIKIGIHLVRDPFDNKHIVLIIKELKIYISILKYKIPQLSKVKGLQTID